jgi:Bacterial regulatory proteins, luxR family
MTTGEVRLGRREQQIADLLLQGCDNMEIAKQLKMAKRTVKAHFNRLFMRFGINSGIKRVKLATLLYRRQLCLETNGTVDGYPVSASTRSLHSLPKDSRIVKSPTPSAPRSMSSKTIFAPSTTNSGSGIESNLPSGTKPEKTNKLSEPDLLEPWEHRVMGLGAMYSQQRSVGKV